MADLAMPARTWLTLQEQHVHGCPYKISTYMVDLTRPARTWLTLKEQHGKVSHVHADLVRPTMYVLIL
jgi:hypothetical protein